NGSGGASRLRTKTSSDCRSWDRHGQDARVFGARNSGGLRQRRSRGGLDRDEESARATDGQRPSVSSGGAAEKVSRGGDEGAKQLRLPASNQARRRHAGARRARSDRSLR